MFSSLISKFIVVLLALGLVISLGVGSDFVSFGMSKNVVAEINNNEISKEEFQYFRNTRLSQLPKDILQDKKSINIINEQIVYIIATRKALASKARELGFVVTDKELRNKITNSELFKDKGKFIGLESYKTKVRNVFGLSEDIFEEILIEEILNDKLKTFLLAFVSVSKEEVENEFVLNLSKINFYLISGISNKEDLPDFSEQDIDNFIKNDSNLDYDRQSVFKVFSIDYEDLTSQIPISQEDIDNYIKNYPNEFDAKKSNVQEERKKIIQLIKKRVAKNLFIAELKKIKELIETSTFDNLAVNYKKTDEIFKLTLTNPPRQLPKPLIDELANSDFSIGKPNVYFFDETIWLVSPESYSNNKEYAMSKMIKIAETKNQVRLLDKILKNSSRSPEELLEAIKDDNDYSYEFKYDISLRDFERILGKKIDMETFTNEKFFVPSIFGEEKKFIIYIEKIRKANREFISFDEFKIRNSLVFKKQKDFIKQFTDDIMQKSKIELNNKYFRYQ